MFAASTFVHTDIIDIQRLDIFQQQVVLDLIDLAECIAQHTTVVIHEYGFAVVIEHGFKFLFVILGCVGFEQVWTQHMMHHVYLMQQFNNTLDILFVCFSYQTIFPVQQLLNKGDIPRLELLCRGGMATGEMK